MVHCLAVLVRSMSSPTLVHIGLGAASQQAYIEIAPGKNFAARLDWQSELGAIWWDNKQTDAAENIHLAPLCYAGG